MISNEIKRVIKEEKNVIVVSEINYNNKEYVKTIKMLEKEIEYIYYEIQGKEIKKVESQETIEYFRKKYEINEGGIIY